MTNDDIRAAERLREALQMADFGIEMMRQNLRRAHPDDTPDEIRAKLERWLTDRPGSEFGDAPGKVRRWPDSHGDEVVPP